MPLLDQLSKKITATTQNVVRSTKEFADTARLNSMIGDEQRKIDSLYAQIGKLYYENEEHKSETEIGQHCNIITIAMERIEELQAEINQIKGVVPCPVCGADVPLSSTFCGGCGTKTVDDNEIESDVQTGVNTKSCQKCGEGVEEDLVFCTSCGNHMESE
ncbi:MAG: zinc ribbon domain-containing protein [Oscillospiraceae bacterium]|nr:zinc ribbon domain-containing protein [Oscillospiraceae bacterium]MCL2279382.1 zinc ribbon domain-containing protein [Oscillospiraceae bacterium]